GRGHGPTAFVGADVYSIRVPTAQKMSTGRPLQPQRPPGSMHEFLPPGTMHLPLLLQPEVKPQRWPDGHCESLTQRTAGACPLRIARSTAIVHVRHANRIAPSTDHEPVFCIFCDRARCCFLRFEYSC